MTPEEIRTITEEVVKASSVNGVVHVEPKSYITITQGIISIIGSVLVAVGFAITYMNGVEAKYQLHEQRIAKVEYQNQISIADRADLRSMVITQGGSISDIKATLGVINNKLDDIRAKQGK